MNFFHKNVKETCFYREKMNEIIASIEKKYSMEVIIFIDRKKKRK